MDIVFDDFFGAFDFDFIAGVRIVRGVLATERSEIRVKDPCDWLFENPPPTYFLFAPPSLSLSRSEGTYLQWCERVADDVPFFSIWPLTCGVAVL